MLSMLSMKPPFRSRKLAFILGAVLAGAVLTGIEAPQAAAGSGHFKVTNKIPDGNPCKKDDTVRHEALQNAVRAVLSAGVASKIDEEIEAAVKGKGTSVPADIRIELAADWQTYQKIVADTSGSKITDAGAQHDFASAAVISRDVSKNGSKQIATVFFCNKHLQEAFTQKLLPAVFVRALAQAEARAILFAGVAKSDLPAGYSTGEDVPGGAGDAKVAEHVDALLKLVSEAATKEAAAPAAAPAQPIPAGKTQPSQPSSAAKAG
jgi:hypothetical protein